MFKFFKSNPLDKLQKQYAKKLEEARDAQRRGQIPVYATLTSEAEEIGRQIDDLKRRQDAGR